MNSLWLHRSRFDDVMIMMYLGKKGGLDIVSYIIPFINLTHPQGWHGLRYRFRPRKLLHTLLSKQTLQFYVRLKKDILTEGPASTVQRLYWLGLHFVEYCRFHSHLITKHHPLWPPPTCFFFWFPTKHKVNRYRYCCDHIDDPQPYSFDRYSPGASALWLLEYTLRRLSQRESQRTFPWTVSCRLTVTLIEEESAIGCYENRISEIIKLESGFW